MEPSPSCKKRKRNSSPTREKLKRVKTEPESGGPPRVSVAFNHLQKPVTLEDLMELLQFAVLGKSGGVKQPSWCRLRHQKRVTKVNIVVLEGLTQSHFYKHYLTLEHLRTNYTTRLSFTPSSSSLASGIFSSEVPGSEISAASQRDQRSSQLQGALRWHPVIRRFGTVTRGLTAYTLTEEEMIKKHFPVKGLPGFEGFVCTDSDARVTDSSPLYGIDCEMCMTLRGRELTRVSLVDSRGRCLLDQLVKPQNWILDYCTKFSGVTAEMLRPVTTTLREVQTKLRQLLPRDAVLVGHSLDADLNVLNLIHPHVIDTSLLYMREFGQRFKLKVLAEAVLQKQIQSEERMGHDPTEDATATLELAQYFIKTGPLQVVEHHLEALWGGYVTVDDSTDSGYTPTPPPTPTPPAPPTQSNRFSDVLQRSGQSAVYIGKRDDITLDLSNQQWHSSDKEVLDTFRRKTECPSFSVVHFSSFSGHLKRSYSHPEQHYQRVCSHLRDMCVVFAGPFPAAFSETDVRRLFCRCGAVRNIRMLNATLRVHAEVEFELLEGALLAVNTLNRLNVRGQHIKVQRPVHESMLDVDLTLDALMKDPLNTNTIYAAALKPKANHTHTPATANRHKPDAQRSDVTAVKKANGSHLPVEVNGTASEDSYCSEFSVAVNGTGLDGDVDLLEQLHATSSGPSEEELREAFGRFGTVESVFLPAKISGTHNSSLIRFENSESTQSALGSLEELLNHGYLVCPSLTPPHLHSWVTMTTPGTATDTEGEAPIEERERNSVHTSAREMERVMRRLNLRLRKLFKSLPDHTLSVVLLPGHISCHGSLPGLCFMEVKQTSPSAH